jgi:sugar/nucleoside kinase (ribokinase family)
VDFLVVNEIEAGAVTGLGLKSARGTEVAACVNAAKSLLSLGVRRQVVIHFTEGAVAVDAAGEVVLQGSLRLPAGFIVGATGAGDGFAAGFLHGVHEGWSTQRSVQLGVCAAAACLTHPTPSGGLRPVDECLTLGTKHGYRAL